MQGTRLIEIVALAACTIAHAQPAPSQVSLRVGATRALDDTTLTGDALAKKIGAAYLPGLVRCFGEARRVDPTAKVDAKLGFVVTEAGRVERPHAEAATKPLIACLEAQTSGWRFPIPKDKDGDATSAEFEVHLEPGAPAIPATPSPPSTPPPDLDRRRPGSNLTRYPVTVTTLTATTLRATAIDAAFEAKAVQDRFGACAKLRSKEEAAKRLASATVADSPADTATVVALTVDRKGAATATAVTDPNAKLRACVTALVRTLKLEVPRDDAGKPTTATFELRVEL